ncbi:protein O-mannosyl-transferase Tmtc3-like [Rhipicephalus sanguineus]|uniref:protein O-mannosyl-transferase Tmtc3-like n=1 Tax=Rhipicephalus sanguineus TaxID=34632 RepID=UPI001894757D|nr:protein O-mannosyl-transferase Tmtc3-like [Rhipicephalus sanguineus]
MRTRQLGLQSRGARCAKVCSVCPSLVLELVAEGYEDDFVAKLTVDRWSPQIRRLPFFFLTPTRETNCISFTRTKEAQEVYERALSLDATNPDILYNLGVVFLEQGRPGDALMYFNKALELDPDHEQALMNSAILIQESGNSKLRQLAFER